MFGLLGDSYELTFTKAGEYPYYCILHSGGPDDEHGMTGKIIVQEDAHGSIENGSRGVPAPVGVRATRSAGCSG